jgi:hypothetical protein
MNPLLFLILVLGFPGQPPTAREKSSRLGECLDVMKQSLAHAQLRDAGTQGGSYGLRAEPILRFTNTVGDSRDGAIFLWLGVGDRPGAAVQVFLRRDGDWYQQCVMIEARGGNDGLESQYAFAPPGGSFYMREFQPAP